MWLGYLGGALSRGRFDVVSCGGTVGFGIGGTTALFVVGVAGAEDVAVGAVGVLTAPWLPPGPRSSTATNSPPK